MTTTTEAAPVTAFLCPDWCRLEDPRHNINLDKGRAVVDHDGPTFGSFINAGGMTKAETGEVLELEVTVHDLDDPDVEVLVDGTWYPGELRQWVETDTRRVCHVSWRSAPTETRLDPFPAERLRPASP